MSRTRATRPIPIALTALVAFLSALAALAVSNGMDMAQAHGNQPQDARAPMTMSMTIHSSSAQMAKAVALRTDMRKLWEDHITWTRLAIISLETGTPDTNATVARLLRNQTDIGNAIFDMEALIVSNCLFTEVLNPLVFFPGPPQFEAPNVQLPGNLAPTVTFPGNGTAVAGIIDTIENPCCCKLLVDLEWIAIKNNIIGQTPTLPVF